MTVLVKGGTLVTHESTWRGDVLCHDGIIQAIGTGLDTPAGATVIDAGGQLDVSRGAGRYIKRKPFAANGGFIHV